MNTALTLLAALAVAATQAQAPARTLEVHFIDVGQGDSMFIRSPAGKTILIDAGNIGAGAAVNDYLDGLGVEGLDLVVVSHPHLDHMGGMKEVLEKHRPKTYLDPEYDHPIDNYGELLDWLETNDIVVKTGRAGRKIPVEEGITLELFSPEEPLLKGTRSDVNSNSIVMKLVYGSVSFLFTGDSEDETEQRVMTRADDLASTVLKVAHHGGKHSTSEGWLAKVNPQYAVISCGSYNRYGHPTKEVLDRLGARSIEVYRTDRHGDVIARTDGKTISWETTGDRSARIDEKGGVRSYSKPKADDPGHRPKPAPVEAKAVPKPDEPKAEVATVTAPTDTAGKAPPPKARPGAAFRTPVASEEESAGRLLARTARRLDLNTAKESDLVALGLEEEEARAVVEYRQSTGPFTSVGDLEKVDGLSPQARARVAPRLTVDGTNQ